MESNLPSALSPGPMCPMNCAVEELGSRAALVLLRQAFYGDRRFDAFVQHTGLSEATAAKRLRELVKLGVLRKVPYREAGDRERYEYELTAEGEELFPVILAFFTWGREHLARAATGLRLVGPDGEPVRVVIQAANGQILTPGDVDIEIDDVAEG